MYNLCIRLSVLLLHKGTPQYFTKIALKTDVFKAIFVQQQRHYIFKDCHFPDLKYQKVTAKISDQ
jgi:hypothetical protein